VLTCPSGFYCPANSLIPIQLPPNSVQSGNSFACIEGFYVNPSTGLSCCQDNVDASCSECIAGFRGVGMIVQEFFCRP
jgi:hypothetical protein